MAKPLKGTRSMTRKETATWTKERRREFLSPTEQSCDAMILKLFTICTKINKRLIKDGCKVTYFEDGKPVHEREGIKFAYLKG